MLLPPIPSSPLTPIFLSCRYLMSTKRTRITFTPTSIALRSGTSVQVLDQTGGAKNLSNEMGDMIVLVTKQLFAQAVRTTNLLDQMSSVAREAWIAARSRSGGA